MDTSREDFGIAIRSAFLRKGTKQRFSLFALVVVSVVLLFVETIETKPLNYFRSLIKDVVYRSSVIISSPTTGLKLIINIVESHLNLVEKNIKLEKDNTNLRNQVVDPDFLIFENKQLRKLLDEQVASPVNLLSARVMIDKQSPYLNSFIINIGSNKKIKKGMAVLDGKNFVGRIVDVNFFSSRILLVSDLNSKIPVIIEPSGNQAIMSGNGKSEPILEFLPKNNTIESGNKIYTSGKEGIFSPGIPIGKVRIDGRKMHASLFSDLSQIMFVNINLGNNNN